jgi:NAD(P)-dependent dehydrogenase (short-subunit alcohol dehydrogenase family)
MALVQGKVALVTGGSSGIGRAAALSFAREGARVVVAARGADRGEAVVREIRQAGGEAVFVQADVTKAGDVDALVSAALTAFGRIDCAFNNAGAIEGAPAPLADLSEESFDREILGNLKSVFLCLRAELRQMLKQDPPGGAIVNTSSINGLGGVGGAAGYATAKAGVLALTKTAALEYGRSGIRVNALVAGAFRTPMLEEAMARVAGRTEEAIRSMEARYQEFIALGRIGSPEEAGTTAVWLCSPAASYLTGHSLIVDGGMTAPYR